jgi:NADH-quinone oxidoreductase subunit C
MSTALQDDVRHVSREQYLELMSELYSSGYKVCIDVTAVDYLEAMTDRVLPDGVVGERFEVVVNLLSHADRHRVRVRVQVPETEPEMPSLYDYYPGTEAMEREVYDLMGIRFSNHPDPTRILMPEDWEGHPLRKDYAQGRIPVAFKYTQGKYSAEDRP